MKNEYALLTYYICLNINFGLKCISYFFYIPLGKINLALIFFYQGKLYEIFENFIKAIITRNAYEDSH